MPASAKNRDVFFISDRTGKTAESIGQSLLSQFEDNEFEFHKYPFVTTLSEVENIAETIRQKSADKGQSPVVFSTLVNAQFQQILVATGACIVDLFFTFIEPLEKHLNAKSSHTIGKTHQEIDDSDYHKRIEALDFTIKNDDGVRIGRFDDADVIIIGVSRSGKTPTCLYLAMHFSVKAANYPLTEEDLDKNVFPGFLEKYADKVVGLTISPDQLSVIREQRRPHSDYSALKNCQKEVKQAETIMQHSGIMIINSTTTSIEEMAVRIVREKRLLVRK